MRAGDLKRGSPWSLQPLADLGDAIYRIPDIAPTRGDGTIYTAINLSLYLSSNPEGFVGGKWTVGQTLDSLGIRVVTGQIPGVEGILWATSPFEFDPDSSTGWSPVDGPATLLNSTGYQAANGDIQILAAHTTTSVPEPASIMIFTIGILYLLVIDRRRRPYSPFI